MDMRVVAGELQVASSHALVEGEALLFDSVLLAGLPSQGHLGGKVDEEGEVRVPAARGGVVQTFDQGEVDPAPVPLVGEA